MPNFDFLIKSYHVLPTSYFASVSNQRNPATRHYTGMSAAAERGMVTRIMRLYEGYGDLYIARISRS